MAEEQKSRLGNVVALITALTGLIAALAAGIPAVSNLFNKGSTNNQSANATTAVNATVAATGNSMALTAAPTQSGRAGSPMSVRGAVPDRETVSAPATTDATHTVESPDVHEEPASDPAPVDE